MMLSVTSFYKNSPRSKKIFRNNNNTTASIKCCGGSFITISRSIFCRYSKKWLANILILLNEICIRLRYHIPMREMTLKCFNSMNHLRTNLRKCYTIDINERINKNLCKLKFQVRFNITKA